MKRIGMKKSAILGAAILALSACSTDQVIDNTVEVAGGTTKIVAKGVVGAGKMVYRGMSGGEN